MRDPQPRERARLPQADGWQHLAGFDPGGRTFVTYGPALTRWGLDDGRRLEEWRIPPGIGFWAYSPDRRHAALSVKDQGVVYILRLAVPPASP
jgi:hypothetical protein